MKSTLKSIQEFLNQDTASSRIVKLLLLLAFFCLLGFLIGDLNTQDPVKIVTTLALFGALASLNVYLIPDLTQKESTKWRLFSVVAAFMLAVIFLGVFQVVYMPLMSIIFVGGYTFVNITSRDPAE